MGVENLLEQGDGALEVTQTDARARQEEGDRVVVGIVLAGFLQERAEAFARTRIPGGLDLLETGLCLLRCRGTETAPFGDRFARSPRRLERSGQERARLAVGPVEAEVFAQRCHGLDRAARGAVERAEVEAEIRERIVRRPGRRLRRRSPCQGAPHGIPCRSGRPECDQRLESGPAIAEGVEALPLPVARPPVLGVELHERPRVATDGGPVPLVALQLDEGAQ